MSDQPTMTGHHLSDVLNRIQVLARQETLDRVDVADTIPRLTETYTGQGLRFQTRQVTDLPRLEQQFVRRSEAHQGDAETMAAVTEQALQAIFSQQREELLRTLEPIVAATIRKVLLDELEVLEDTLQQEVMAVLHERIESLQT